MQTKNSVNDLPNIVIKSEEDAYEVLRSALAGTIQPFGTVIFDGWPTLNLNVKGDKFHQSLTPTVMRGLLEFQKGIYQSFAAAKYNHPSKRLSESEKKDLEIRVDVHEGSSDLDINFNEIAIKLVEQLGARMDPVHVLITVVTIAVLYFGNSAFRSFLESRKEVRLKEISDGTHRKTIEALTFAGQQETERAKIISDLAANNHRIGNISRIAYQAQSELVKSLAAGDSASVEGIPLDSAIAEELTRNARKKSQDIRLDGTYRLVKIDWSDPLKLKVKVFNVDNRLTLDAEVQDDSLTGKYREALRDAEWNRVPVNLRINAKVFADNDYRDAVVISAEPLTPTEGN